MKAIHKGFLSIFFAATALNVIAAPTPIAHWDFESTADGIADNTQSTRHSGSIEGAQPVPGKVGQGLYFDGEDDRIVVPHHQDLSFIGTDSFSLAVWVKPSDPYNNWQGIVTKSRDELPWYGLWLDPNARWTFGHHNIYAGTADQQWHFLVLVQDGTNNNRRMYLDGQLVSYRASARSAHGSGDLVIGAALGVDEFFTGAIDEVMIFDIALSEQHIAELMEPPTKAHAKPQFEWPSGTYVNYVQVALEKTGQIYYSLNGSDPDTSSIPYDSPFVVAKDDFENGTVTIKAISYGDEGQASEIAQVSYDLTGEYPRVRPFDDESEIKREAPIEYEMELAYWSFDENSGIEAQLTDAGPKLAQGKYRQAIEFDGIDDALQLKPLVPEYSPSEIPFQYTLSLWVQADSEQNGWATIISQLNGYVDDIGIWISPAGEWTFTGGFTAGEVEEGWQHLALVQNDTSRLVYLNGTLVASAEARTHSSTNQFELGGHATRGEYFKGKIDDLRIYTGAATPKEVTQLATVAPPLLREATAHIPDLQGYQFPWEVGHSSIDPYFFYDAPALTWPDKKGYYHPHFPLGWMDDGGNPHYIRLLDFVPEKDVIFVWFSYFLHTERYNTTSFKVITRDIYGHVSDQSIVTADIDNYFPVVNGGLVGRWLYDKQPLDYASASPGLVIDESGNDFNGQVIPANLNLAPREHWSDGLQFSGDGQHIVIPDAPELRFAEDDDFALSVWFKPYNIQNGWQGIVTKSRDLGDWWGIWLSPDGKVIFGSENGHAASESAIEGQWQHVVIQQIVGPGVFRSVYLNGRRISDDKTKSALGSGDLVIGGAKGVDEFFNGEIDDIQLYKRRLSYEEIAYLAEKRR